MSPGALGESPGVRLPFTGFPAPRPPYGRGRLAPVEDRAMAEPTESESAFRRGRELEVVAA